jgi:hypothetical protein
LFAPFYRTENVQKGDHIRKVGLVIAHEQDVLTRKIFNVFGTGDGQFIEPHQPGIGHHAHDEIDELTHDIDPFQSFSECTHWLDFINASKLRKC